MTNNRTYALSGASGYLGSHLLKKLSATATDTYILGRHAPKSLQRGNFVPFELGAKNDLRVLKQADVLIHCAYDFRPSSANDIFATNVEGTLDLFKQAQAHNVKKIIYISSLSASPQAKSYYGQAKYRIEEMSENFNATIIRPGLIYGHKAGGIVGAMAGFVNKWKFVPLIGNGSYPFYLSYVDDLVNLILEVSELDRPTMRPIIAASEKSHTLKEIILSIAQEREKDIILLPLPFHLLLLGLSILEMLGLKIPFRSDSLRSLTTPTEDIDFSESRKLSAQFRPFAFHD